MNNEEINYWCERVVNARNKTDLDHAINMLRRELEADGPFDAVDFVPGSFKVIGKYVGPLEVLGIPIVTDDAVQPGKIEFRDTFDFDFDPGNAA